MSILTHLLSQPNRVPSGDCGDAARIIRSLNPRALIGVENGTVVIIEDCCDPDGRMYRLEYQSSRDGRRAKAFCRFNPWGSKPSAGVSAHQGHIFRDGSICMGGSHSLEAVVQRARYWCTACSVFKETGQFPQP